MKYLPPIIASLLGAVLLALHSAPAEELQFAAQAEHVGNRLRHVLYTRAADDGKPYVYEGLETPMASTSHFLIDGPSHKDAIAELDQFLRTDADRQIKDPLKRALLLRDLWYVFDQTAQPFEAKEDGESGSGARLLRRRTLQKRLAQVMRRLELSAEEIKALPDNYTLAVKSGAFARDLTEVRRDRPYLPPDLLRPDSPWILVTSADHPRGQALAAPQHAAFAGGRSVFLVFLKLPEGRKATLAYLGRLAASKKPVQFPDGTQVGLMRLMVLVNDQGRLQLTLVTESLQLRVFPTMKEPEALELVLDRKALLSGRAGSLRALTVRDEDYFNFGTHFNVMDPFEGRHTRLAANRPLSSCSTCHSGAAGQDNIYGIFSIRTFGFGEDWRGAAPTDLASQLNETLDHKRTSYAWGLYQGLRESEPRGTKEER
jgi:hypothetical protein